METRNTSNPPSNSPSSQAPERRSYTQSELRVLVFRLAAFEYAVDVGQVQEIVRPGRLLSMGGVPHYVAGVIKHRGSLVPIVDLRRRLGLPVAAPSPETCAVMVKLPAGPVGLVVDAAVELLWVKTQAFEIPSPVLVPIEHVLIQGVAKVGERLLVMLDLVRLFSPGEQQELAELGTGTE